MRSTLLNASLIAVLICAAAAEQLRPATVAAFDQYVNLSEQRMAGEMSTEKFLRFDSLSIPQREDENTRLQKGEVVTEKLQTLNHNSKIEVSGGLIHHWIGTVFIPGATLTRTLEFLQDYDAQPKFYSPRVQRAHLMKRSGDEFKVFIRLQETKAITVVLNTEYDVKYTVLDANRATATSRSIRIAEVTNPGKPGEAEKPVGSDNGFLWRLNSYWRFRQANGGVYVQLEAISLTRDIPVGLGWMVEPFIDSIPEESLAFTLGRTREALVSKISNKNARTPAAGLIQFHNY